MGAEQGENIIQVQNKRKGFLEEVIPRRASKNEWKFDPDPGEGVSGREDSITKGKQAASQLRPFTS